MMPSLETRTHALIAELGLGSAADVHSVIPLTGGVASDIAQVRMKDSSLCVKFALPKLKVAEDWRAPVHRNAAEYAWLSVAARILPEAAVRLYGRSEALHGFAMEFLEGEAVYLWKTALLDGLAPPRVARDVGDMLGRIHAASAGDGFDVAPFQNRDDFFTLRIEPYLTFTATRHPAVAPQLTVLAAQLYEASDVLVHGDVSPKNILVRSQGPVILDAECATMGDAAFDPSFCLNHLALKAAHLPDNRAALLRQMTAFWDGYRPYVHWEDPAELEARVCRLLPALLLARVDGKSPAEYIDEATRTRVRTTALALLTSSIRRLPDLIQQIEVKLKGSGR
jgi:aminoglycoside phosphotransferase (APT) family kinase protein